MDDFNAEDFVRRLQSGEFDHALTAMFRKLTGDQLEEVALLVLNARVLDREVDRAKGTGSITDIHRRECILKAKG
jgi:hypothetical protein